MLDECHFSLFSTIFPFSLSVFDGCRGTLGNGRCGGGFELADDVEFVCNELVAFSDFGLISV